MVLFIERRQNQRYMHYFSHAYKASFRKSYTMCCPVSLSVPPVMGQPSYEVIMFLRLIGLTPATATDKVIHRWENDTS